MLKSVSQQRVHCSRITMTVPPPPQMLPVRAPTGRPSIHYTSPSLEEKRKDMVCLYIIRYRL